MTDVSKLKRRTLGAPPSAAEASTEPRDARGAPQQH